jgi:uncharacterized membrane protein
MWRHVFEPNLRDHAFWRWLAPHEIHRASEDGWQLFGTVNVRVLLLFVTVS